MVKLKFLNAAKLNLPQNPVHRSCQDFGGRGLGDPSSTALVTIDVVAIICIYMYI